LRLRHGEARGGSGRGDGAGAGEDEAGGLHGDRGVDVFQSRIRRRFDLRGLDELGGEWRPLSRRGRARLVRDVSILFIRRLARTRERWGAAWAGPLQSASCADGPYREVDPRWA